MEPVRDNLGQAIQAVWVEFVRTALVFGAAYVSVWSVVVTRTLPPDACGTPLVGLWLLALLGVCVAIGIAVADYVAVRRRKQVRLRRILAVVRLALVAVAVGAPSVFMLLGSPAG